MGSRSDRSPLPAPGARLEIEIDDISSRGLGVGRTSQGEVVMVREAAPGDRAAVEVRSRHRSWVEADLVAVIRPSSDRVRPRCRHFGSCGGCALQHLSIAAQRRLKTRRIRELLRRTAGLTGVVVDEAVAVGPDYGYRNRMEFSVGGRPDGAVIGLHDLEGEIFDLAECHLPVPAVPRWVERIREVVRAFPAAGTGETRSASTVLRRLDLRWSRSGGEWLLGVTAEGPLPGPLAAALAALAGERRGPRTVVLLAPLPHVLVGPGFVREEILGLELAVQPGAFSQTNFAGAEAIYRASLRWLEPVADGGFLDLYSGAGLLALAAAGRSARVVAVERSAGSVAAGRRAAAESGLAVRFLHADALAGAIRLAQGGASFSAVVANPPRAGLDRRLPSVLRDLGVRRMAYISCDPATLCRDLRRLEATGFRTKRVSPFDIFPQTAEIEAVAFLQKEREAGPVDGKRASG
jgi:23S rRNA (uracil1939-C5)-methyltransferase